MYAVIDLETTGGQPPRDRITEIAIYLYDGQRITGEFHSLVNPERAIPLAVSRLTGITDDMVREAPKFYEIAKDVVEMTEGRIFVAHNARFDYGFLKAAFGELGYSFQRKTLCTVRLSRKFLPGYPSYSLGKLCRSLAIEVEGRHRAYGDAAATTELLGRILQKVSPDALDSVVEAETQRVALPSRLDPAVVERLPVATGVYYFHDADGKILYVGKSVNIRQRVMDHLRIDFSRKREAEFKERIADITWYPTGNELIALLHEAAEISRHQPPFNRALKHRADRFGLYIMTDPQGYKRIQLKAQSPGGTRQRQTPLMLFRSTRNARRYLTWVAETHGICKKMVGAEAGKGPCFDFQLHQCKGACVGDESPESHNERFQAFWQQRTDWAPSLLVVGPGRTNDEHSVVWVENYRYKGFGFLPKDQPISHPEELEDYLQPAEDSAYARALVRGHINQHHEDKVVVLERKPVLAD